MNKVASHILLSLGTTASCSDLARPPLCGPTGSEPLSFRQYGSKVPAQASEGVDTWVLPEEGTLPKRPELPG